jgi:signal transduction histidine kinase
MKKQYEDLQKTNFELDHFVYSISHDLRAPLTSVLSLISVAEDEHDPELFKADLALIKYSMGKMDGFIKDILSYSRNARLGVVYTPIDFRQLITDCIENLTWLNGDKRITYTLDIRAGIAFHSDKMRLGILFTNLISNAIKYQDHAKAKPEVRIDIENVGNYIHIRFSDNGIGIAEQYQDRIFNMFYRATSNSSGAGLGLYLVREALKKIDGEISFQSEEGAGTTFHIILPAGADGRMVQQQGASGAYHS